MTRHSTERSAPWRSAKALRLLPAMIADWYRVTVFHGLIALAPRLPVLGLLFAAPAAAALAFDDQTRELILSTLEAGPDEQRWALALGAALSLTLGAAALLAVELAARRAHRAGFRSIRSSRAVLLGALAVGLLAAAPWLAALVGLGRAQASLEPLLGLAVAADAAALRLRAEAAFAPVALGAAAFGLLGFVVAWARRAPMLLLWGVVLLAAASLVAQMSTPAAALVALAQTIGPLATGLGAIIGLVGAAAAVLAAFGRLGLPPAPAAALVVLGWALVAWLWPSPTPPEARFYTEAAPVERWLAQRLDAQPAADAATGPTPLYVVVAPGGGVYAAAHAGVVLAALADCEPRFLEHVVAISGVSGGAVGAALALAAAEPPASAPGACLGAAPGPIEARVRAALARPHLAPVLALRARDVALTRDDQARALADSFVVGLGAAKGGPTRLEAAYAADSARPGPALLSNVVGVATGAPEVFAPFAFASGAPDAALRSLDETLGPTGAHRDPGFRLIDAAVASARFPYVMAPWRAADAEGATREYADGGYLDASGADSAGALIERLRAVLAKRPDGARFALRVILLTTDDGAEDRGRGAAVTSETGDLLAPARALLAVRERLASRARDRLERGLDGAELHRLSLDVAALEAPLAWSLSRVRLDALADASVGRGERCAAPASEPPVCAGASAVRARCIAAANACALQQILGELGSVAGGY